MADQCIWRTSYLILMLRASISTKMYVVHHMKVGGGGGGGGGGGLNS